MKKSLLALATFLFVLIMLASAFKSDPPFENLLDEAFKKEFISETSSEQLITNLADVYSHEFDKIAKVDIHLNESDGYYFTAYGLKDDQSIVRMIKASDEMATLQFYPSRADMGFESNAVVINCHCSWILCLPGGQGKICGIARDEMSHCKPSSLCPIKIDPKDID